MNTKFHTVYCSVVYSTIHRGHNNIIPCSLCMMWVTGDTIASGVLVWYRMWFTEDTIASYTAVWCMIWFIADTTDSFPAVLCTIWFTTDTKASWISNHLILFRVQKTNMNNEIYLRIKIKRHTTTHTLCLTVIRTSIMILMTHVFLV